MESLNPMLHQILALGTANWTISIRVCRLQGESIPPSHTHLNTKVLPGFTSS
jgi:hypothetical protein